MLRYLLKRKKFLFGVLFLGSLLLFSFLHSGGIKQVAFHTDSKGNLLDAPPYRPLTVFWLGSDKFGYSLGDMIVSGAKYTIGISLIITLFRMLLSLVVSYFVFTFRPFFYKGLQTVFEPFSLVPQTIIAFFILYNVLWMPAGGFLHPFWQRILFESVVLILIALPNLIMHLSSEMRIVVNEPFIEVSQTLGARKPHLFFKHILPHLYEKWILLFGQQFIQVLQLLAHLGFMKLFFGGTVVDYVGGPPRSTSYEWSGLIGDSIGYLYVHQWILLVPMAFFGLTALSVAFINDSLKAYFQKENELLLKKQKG